MRITYELYVWKLGKLIATHSFSDRKEAEEEMLFICAEDPAVHVDFRETYSEE